MRYAIQGATVQQVKATGGSGIKEAKKTNIIFADLTIEQAGRLKAKGFIVNRVGWVKATVTPTITPPKPVAAEPRYTAEQLSWAAGLEELRKIQIPPQYGEGFTAAVIDTGLRASHTKIINNVVYERNYTTAPMRDGLNHGTGVASIITTVAPLCNILNLKVMDDEGMGTEEAVVLAIDDCIDLYDSGSDIAPCVINLSLGAPDDGNPQSPMRVACREAIKRNIWVLASAGNEGPAAGSITSPACERYVGAVGSLSYEPFTISKFSGRGPSVEGLIKPDTCFFAEHIIVASSESNTATIAKSGTSFATPFMSGMAVIYHQSMSVPGMVTTEYPGIIMGVPAAITMEELIEEHLVGFCGKPEGVVTAKDNAYGYGMVFGPLVAEALGVKPAVGIEILMSSIAPILMLGLLGAVIAPMAKGFK